MTEAKKEKTCFVIGPIGEEGTESRARSDRILNHVVTPAVQACGYGKPVRADQISKPGLITTQVIERLLDSDLVVADLTAHNANAFYELAVRHAVRKPVVQLIELGDSIPFDVAQSRTVQVDHHDLDSVARCISELQAQITAAETNPMVADNPITMTIDLQALRSSGDPASKRDAELLEMVQEIRATVSRIEMGVGEAQQTAHDIIHSEASRHIRARQRATLLRGMDEIKPPKIDPELLKYLAEAVAKAKVQMKEQDD